MELFRFRGVDLNVPDTESEPQDSSAQSRGYACDAATFECGDTTCDDCLFYASNHLAFKKYIEEKLESAMNSTLDGL